jgi:hypothetical protein
MSTFDGHLLKMENDILTEITDLPIDQGKGFFCHVDSQDILWITQSGFFGKWENNTWNEAEPMSNFEGIDQFFGSGSGKNGDLWIIDKSHLIKFQNGERKATYDCPDGIAGFWSLTVDSKGFIWVASFTSGIYRMSPDEDGDAEWTHYTEENGTLTSNNARFIFEDRENHIWIGANGGGLIRFMTRVFQNYGVEHGLKERVLKSVAITSDDRLLIGSFGGGPFDMEWNSIR